MVSRLEREVIEKFYRLDRDAQKRVRELIVQETAPVGQADAAAFDYATWWAEVESIRQEIRATHGDKLPPMDVVGTLRDIRDGEDE